MADNPPCKNLTVRELKWPRKDCSTGYRPQQWKRTKDMDCATWNIRSLYITGRMKELAEQLSAYKIDICGLQEMRWPGKGIIHQNKYTWFYSGNETGKHEFGTGFYVTKRMMSLILNHIMREFVS